MTASFKICLDATVFTGLVWPNICLLILSRVDFHTMVIIIESVDRFVCFQVLLAVPLRVKTQEDQI